MKLRLLLFLSVFASLCCFTTQAQTTVEQWTFDGANPENGINGTIQSVWTTAAPNSVPSAGVLRFATVGDANFGDANRLPDINTSNIASMTWTIVVTDLYIQAGETIRFTSITTGTGVPEVEFTSWGDNPGVNDNFSPDIEYTGKTDDLDVAVTSLNGSPLGGPLTMVATWDFVNNTMSFETSGTVVASGSMSTASDLSDAIGTITGFRVRGDGANSWMNLDEVRIETVVLPTFPTWTGATDTDWATAGNWDTGVVPIATDNVIIPEVTNAPVIGASTAAVCNNLTITETDGVTVSFGGTLTVNGTSSGAINYVNYELVPNGDFATGDYTSWSNSSNNGASSTPEVVLESGNYVAKKTVTATGSNPFDLRTRNRSITAPANATKITFRAKGDGGEQLYLTFGGTPNKVTTTVTLTNQWVDYELPLTNSGGGNAAGTTSDVDFQQLSTGVYYLDDVAFAFPVTWTGATDSDWATASNWSPNKVPTATDDAVIPDVETAPIIGASTAAVCANLTITETDGLVINSGGSLIVNGTSSGNVTYNRNLGTENWYLVSSPVAGQTYDNTYIASNSLAINGTNNAIGSYTTADNTWSYMQTGGGATFTAGQGYSVRRATGQGAGDISFTGTINTDDISYSPTAGFNLIGNPFTASINTADLLTDNTANLVSQTIWVWNQATGNYETKITDDAFVLAPAQGFFINSSNGASINIAESYQTSTTGVFQKTAKTEIKLMMNDGTSERFARVNYTNNATKGFDNGFDGETFNGISNKLDVFTYLLANDEGKKYQVQSLPNSDFENMVVPVGIKADANKEITFSAEAMNIPDGINVYLEDRTANKVTLLSEANATYKVTLGESLDGIGRFYLHTKASGVLSTTDVTLDNISIYAPTKSSLRILGLSQGKATVKLYNILGKQVLNASFISNGIQDITLPKLTTGIYIVQLENENGTLNKKIVLE